jgi:hypothetical protein
VLELFPRSSTTATSTADFVIALYTTTIGGLALVTGSVVFRGPLFWDLLGDLGGVGWGELLLRGERANCD